MSMKFEDVQRLNGKQIQALEEAAARVQRMTDSDLGLWDIAYHPESRPGRGNDITAWAADGEHMATQYLDVYGNGPLVVSRTDLLHNDSDEEHFTDDGECECEAAK